ncbi:helicase POLQ-like [Anopheles ziemanni]|uniref:helicase POLQ-like n=2 Tax=Anopheles coustani TaxID=139045 RepID=UPI0026593E95|nr:helicase POLQ-like [Anopheles coustani]XP_058128394.1 helicase POLQ-like [Anopheles coustani]XP_058176737.1 helicase POLQ-like [Anopheles ziemanni]XP_058176745.1 helicase POLQ-like [Anopheles ziemanni]
MSGNRSSRGRQKFPTTAKKCLISPNQRSAARGVAPAAPAANPVDFRAPDTACTSKPKDDLSTKLLELDNTLLNAVDLASIEKKVKRSMPRTSWGGNMTRAAADQPITPFRKRSKSVGAIERRLMASPPKLQKSAVSSRKIYVLKMNMDGSEVRDGGRDSGCNENLTSNRSNVANEETPTVRPLWSGVENDDAEMLPCGQVPIASHDQLDTDEIIKAKLKRIGSTKPVTHVGDMLRESNGFEVYTNQDICSQYMRQDESLADEGVERIVAIGASQIGHPERPSHFQQVAAEAERTFELQKVSEALRIFEICDRTLHDMTNIEPMANAIGEGSSRMRTSNSTIAAINRDEGISDQTTKPKFTVPHVSSLFLEKGPFFGLPNNVRRMLRDFRGIGELYDWQQECLDLPAIDERRNLIYALPTSGGKTLVVEILMLREIICRLRNVMFVVPYVSSAQEKLIALTPFSIELQFLLEEYTGGRGQCPPLKRHRKNTIFVCTIEKSLILMNSLIEVGRADEIGLIVIDELHMIGEQRHGGTLEMLITKVQSLRAGIQIVGMSASIGNLGELARFMLADVYCRENRPVELKEYIKWGEDLFEVRSQAERIFDVLGEKRKLEFNYGEELRRIDVDHVIGLIMEVIPKGSCLVFCPTRNRCESLCAMLAANLPDSFAQHRAEEKAQIIKSLQDDGSVAPILPHSFRVGVAYHHGRLTQDERRMIEDAFRAGILSVIVCTSTLAASVNLSAKRVIICSPYIGSDFFTLSRYKQMVGHAGRAGKRDTGDSILISAMRDIPQICEMFCSPLDFAESALLEDEGACLKSLVLGSIGLGLCKTRNALQAMVGSTLLAQQAKRREIDLEAITDETIVQLYQGNAIKATHDSCLRNPTNMVVQISAADGRSEEAVGQAFVRVHKTPSRPGKVFKTIDRTSPLEVINLGKAAIRAGFDIERAVRFYNEMQELGKRLCVLDEFDLLFLILLEDGLEVYFKIEDLIILTSKLSDALRKIAARYNISQVVIEKILKRRTVPDETMFLMQRFFRVLIVHDLWSQTDLQEVALKYRVSAGAIQTLMTAAAGTAHSLLRMCEEIPELWVFQHLLTGMTKRLTHYCKLELMPLMELPSMKLGRAKQLYRAGYTTLGSLARAKSKELVETIEYMNYRTANQLILSAKAKLMEQVDVLREQAEEYLSQMNR